MARIDGRLHEVTPWSGVYDKYTAHLALEEDDAEEHVVVFDAGLEDDDPRQNELVAGVAASEGRPRFEVEPA